MQEVVVGIDGSDQSRLALAWAAGLAELTGTRLRVLQAWSYPRLAIIPGGPEPGSRDEMDAQTMTELMGTVESAVGNAPPGMRPEVLRGPATSAILDAVGPESVLVLGTRGRGGFKGMLLGSVSRACIEYAPCPVVIARDRRPPIDGLILVGEDGSEGGLEALRWAASLAGLAGARVAAVHAWQAQSSEVSPRLHARLRAGAQSSIKRWVSEAGATADAIAVEGDPRDKLVELSGELGANLIVVGRRGTSRLTGIATGGVTSYLVSNSSTTVAVLPPTTGPGAPSSPETRAGATAGLPA
jgi:nucleotide-binding universal stress UspA family protein